jgi:hypothetical protein
MVSVTFGHGIYVVSGQVTPRLLSHECRHVHQYEAAGSIAAFLPVYLEQILRVGYGASPLEVDARNWERDRARRFPSAVKMRAPELPPIGGVSRFSI